MSRFHDWRLIALAVPWLAGCVPANPAKPTDAGLSCLQINEEIAAQDANRQASEENASKLRPRYYAVQAIGFVPYVGDVVGLLDSFGHISGERELDQQNENTETARLRREHLAKMQASRCGAGAPGPLPAPAL